VSDATAAPTTPGLLEHLRRLTALGPRGSTTPAEAAAADYAAAALRAAGLTPRVEGFMSARSGWLPYAAFAAAGLMAEGLFLAGGRLGAAAALCLTLFALGASLLELCFQSNPWRWLLPRAASQNVVAAVTPRGVPRARVVVLGHLDSHRTPLVFSSDGWLRLFARLVPLGMVSIVGLAAAQGLAAAGVRGPWGLVSLPFALVLLVLLVLTVQADLTPYTVGANDNASGAAVVLDLAARLAAAPLEQTEVLAVLTGCEEVGCYGAAAFARAHGPELAGAAWIAVDSVGGRGTTPAYVTREVFLLATDADPALVQTIEAVRARRPDLGLHPTTLHGAYTEGAIGGRHGYRVLSLLSCDAAGRVPEWHRPTDRLDRIDPDAVARSATAVWELLQEIDAGAAQGPAAPRP
jgi:hypothetical protein